MTTRDRLPSISDHRDSEIMSPAQADALLLAYAQLEHRIHDLESRLADSSPPSRILDIRLPWGARVRGAAWAVASVLVLLGLLGGIAYVAASWGRPPADGR
jgi:hypothetical protein